ncbi:MAG TPA: diguanylate cyclase, partial [Spirochaetia bacterium]|nr:diguanylate cyclase [Spirochaetia bacterium]
MSGKYDIFESLPVGTAVIDQNRKVIFWNQEMVKLTGLQASEASELQINHALSVYSDANQQQQLDILHCLSAQSEISNAVFIKNISGHSTMCFIKAKAPDTDGNTAIIAADLSRSENCLVIEKRTAEQTAGFYNLTGKDQSMQELYRKIKFAADSLANVLITGESGTGKELTARAIHDLSRRKDGPFISVNCSSLPESLLESELFGYVKGAFTGAETTRIGRFEAAENGSIFLDEIGDISPYIQLKLLRVLQEKTINRLGENREIKISSRVICATNQDLRALVLQGKFREDLFYRLKVFPIETVPLRGHKNDLPLLINHFIGKFNRQTGKHIQNISADALRLLMDYCWPGNVRELEHSVEHAFVVTNGPLIDIFDLPQELRMADARESICGKKTGPSGLTRPVISEESIKKAMTETSGNRTL